MSIGHFAEVLDINPGEDSEMEGYTAEDKELEDELIILTSEKSVKDRLKFISI